MMFILARTGSKESCSHYSSKLIIRWISSDKNCKIQKYLQYWLGTLLVPTYLLKH
uniref:Uncharacterized protein n=1 Tax=Rhizophora mucronata TaxID=61149 RepID=A0A2P2INZ6_RHIMU